MHSLIQWIKKWIRRIVILFCIVGVVTVICLVASLFSDDSADAPTNEGANSEVTQAPKKRVYRSSAQSKSSESVSPKQTNQGSKKVAVPIPQQEKPQVALKKGAYFGVDFGQPISEIPSEYLKKDQDGKVCEFESGIGLSFVCYYPPNEYCGPISWLGEDLPREICVMFDDDRKIKCFIYIFGDVESTSLAFVNYAKRNSDIRSELGEQEFIKKLVADYRSLVSYFELKPGWKRLESVEAKNKREKTYVLGNGVKAIISCSTRTERHLVMLLIKEGEIKGGKAITLCTPSLATVGVGDETSYATKEVLKVSLANEDPSRSFLGLKWGQPPPCNCKVPCAIEYNVDPTFLAAIGGFEKAVVSYNAKDGLCNVKLVRKAVGNLESRERQFHAIRRWLAQRLNVAIDYGNLDTGRLFGLAPRDQFVAVGIDHPGKNNSECFLTVEMPEIARKGDGDTPAMLDTEEDESDIAKLENVLEQYRKVMRLYECKNDQERESKRLRGILGDKLLGRIYDEYGQGEWKSFVSKYEGQIKNAERKKPIPQREESATDIMIGVLEEGLKSSREKFESLKPGEGQRRVLQAQIDDMTGKLNKQKKIRHDEEAKHLKKIQKDIAAQNAELAGVSREMGGQLKSSIEDVIRNRIDACKQRVRLAEEKARAKEEAERARAEEERRREEEARKARIARKRQQMKPDYERAKEWYRDQLEYLGVSELHFGKYRETTQLVLHDAYGAQLNIVLNTYPEGRYINYPRLLAKGFAERLIDARVLIDEYEKGDF